MSLADQIAAYAGVALALVPREDVFGAVDALVARDAQSRWFEDDN